MKKFREKDSYLKSKKAGIDGMGKSLFIVIANWCTIMRWIGDVYDWDTDFLTYYKEGMRELLQRVTVYLVVSDGVDLLLELFECSECPVHILLNRVLAQLRQLPTVLRQSEKSSFLIILRAIFKATSSLNETGC